MRPSPKALFLAAGLLLVTSIGFTDADQPATQPDEQWFLIRMSGANVGTAAERWSRTGSENVFQAQMNLSFTRMGTPLSMTIFTEEVTTPEGAFLRARMQSSVSNLSAVATLKGDSVYYETTAGGSMRRRTLAWKKDAMTEALARERVAHWLESAAPETTITLFDVAEGDFRTQRLVRGKRMNLPVGKIERDVIQVDEYDADAQTPSSSTWYDAVGPHDPERTLVSQLGVEIEILRVSAAELEATQIEPSFDIIKRSMVPCPGFPIPASRMETVTLVLDFPGTLPPASMTGPNQLEVQRAEHAITLKLTRSSAGTITIPEDQQAVFLRPDRFVQSDAKEIKAVADSLKAATRSDTWVLARACAAWVDGHISKKGMEHGYASAVDVYRSRAGDCTEHSLLTTAVLRAAGIPARPVVGLAFSEPDKAFVGHMWVEAYVNGWRTLDALNLGLDPIRIRVYAPASSESLGERDLMRAYGTMAGVKVRATEHQSRK
ncbi:MAG TPA: transglutaminase-like domain-containing protein [Candidatus Krumholzibacteria bacterium]